MGVIAGGGDSNADDHPAPGCSASPCRDHRRRRRRDRGRRRRSLRSHRRRALGSHPAEPLPAVRRRRHDAKRRTGMGWSYSSRARRHPLQALTLTGVTLVAALAAVLTTGLTTSPPGDVRLPWWLVLLYASAEHNVALIRVRREAHTVSASEIPLVLGLAYVSPGALLLARLVGSLAVLAACRRQRPLKLAVNLGAFLSETGVAIAAFYLVLGGQPLEGPRAWVAGLAAAAAGGATSAALITATVGVYEHDARAASSAAGQAVSGALVATLVGTGDARRLHPRARPRPAPAHARRGRRPAGRAPLVRPARGAPPQPAAALRVLQRGRAQPRRGSDRGGRARREPPAARCGYGHPHAAPARQRPRAAVDPVRDVPCSVRDRVRHPARRQRRGQRVARPVGRGSPRLARTRGAAAHLVGAG